MRKLKHVLIAYSMLCCSNLFAYGDTNNFCIGANIGPVTGIGADINYKVMDWVSLRAGVSYVGFEYEALGGFVKDKFDDVAEDKIDRLLDALSHFKLEVLTFPLMVDVHPFSNGFRISAGVFVNSKFSIAGTFDNTKFDSSLPEGTSKAEVGVYDNIMPSFTIGYNGNFSSESRGLGFTFEIGAMFARTVKYSFDFSSIPLEKTKWLNEEFDKFNAGIRENFPIIPLPIVKLGLNYKL